VKIGSQRPPLVATPSLAARSPLAPARGRGVGGEGCSASGHPAAPPRHPPLPPPPPKPLHWPYARRALPISLTRAGIPCRFPPHHGGPFCINHDPAYAAIQATHRRRGTTISANVRAELPINFRRNDITTPEGLQSALARLFAAELSGQLTSRQTNRAVRILALASRHLRPDYSPAETG
jgi:hypothetical protein